MKKISLLAALLLSLPTLAQRMDDGDSHSRYIKAVDEYVPAPGQFTNAMPAATADDTPQTMAQKCTERLADNARQLISLGAFGGYVTFHFDHSIANIAGQRDIYILGNATQATGSVLAGGSSEPGIVMVMKDENGNGLPDDRWLELSGSCDNDSIGKVKYGYSVTYTKQPMQEIPWTDNLGSSGTVERNTFHAQEYFPLWLGESLTLGGTLLPHNSIDVKGDGTYWVQTFMAWGYVDNKPNSDSLACSFDLDWAVDPITREKESIDFVDFIRIYSAEQQTCGWIGETSTEVMGAEDLHLDLSLQAIRTAIEQHEASISSPVVDANAATVPCSFAARRPVVFDLSGRRISTSARGFRIIRLSDGTTRKQITH